MTRCLCRRTWIGRIWSIVTQVLAVVAERRLASLCGVPETRTPVNIFLADSPASSSSALSSNPLPPEAVRQVTAQMSLCDPGDGEPMPED